MRASSTRLSRVHVSETDAPEKKKFNIQAGFGVMFMRVSRTLSASSASPALTKVARRCLLAPTTTHDERMHAAAKPVARTLCAPSASPALTKVARRCLLARATTRDARELDAAKPGASSRLLPPTTNACTLRLSRVHVSETDAPEKKKFNIQAGFGVMFMRVSRTLCAPSASPALTKAARRCLLAPATTRDARELDAAKPGARFGDGCAREEKVQHSGWIRGYVHASRENALRTERFASIDKSCAQVPPCAYYHPRCARARRG
ncbi:hypothetical protein RI054_19g87690 [Pseudoscourfieldia marina]